MKDNNPKPITAHFLKAYLDLSDTFIYQYLRNLRLFRPILIVEETDNLELFPLEANIHCLMDVWERWSWSWFRGKYDRFLARRDPVEALAGRILAKEKPKLLHAHFGPQGVWTLTLKRQYRLPLITTFYGVDMSKLPRQDEWYDAYQQLFAEGDLFLVEGNHMRSRLIELGSPPEKTRIQHIAIDVNQIRFAPRQFPEDGIIKLLLCGRFTEKKGIEYAIRAADLVRNRYQNIELRIIGDGELRPQIEQLISDLHLDEHVTLLGYRSHPEFTEELRKTHIFLAPSITAADGDSEGGAPTVLIEAQASGLPIVSTYHADIPEVVPDGESGFLVPERDTEALAERIVHLIKHPDIWSEIGIAGRKHVEWNHNIYLETQKLESLYTDLVEGADPPVNKEVHDELFASEAH